MESERHNEFIRLLALCKRPLMGYIKHNIWNKALLEDAFQNTVIEAWKKFVGFSGDEQGFRVWIFQIARYVTFNLNRKEIKEIEKYQAEKVIPDTGYRIHDTGWILEDGYKKLLSESQTILNTMEDKVKEAIVLLPDNERNVFLLRSLGEFSYQEISHILSIPIGSVMGYLARARIRLRGKLYDYAREYKYI